MIRIVERPRARQELEDIAVHIGQRRPAAARRFLQAAQKAYDLLASMPESGTLWAAEQAAFAAVCYFPIPRYPNYVIFYRPLADGIEVLHILHGARDLGELLSDESP